MRELDELKFWLEGSEPAQVNWRIDPKNVAQVSEFVNQYANTPGGKMASSVWSKIKTEQRIAEDLIREEEERLETRKALIAVVKADYVANGGTEKAFERDTTKILESYAISGRAEEILNRAEDFRRSQAARTF